MRKKKLAIFYAVLAAALYAVNIPFSKLLMLHISPTMMASFLYLGAGLGLFLLGAFFKLAGKGDKTEHLTKKELPYALAMVLLDIAAPILLMFGLRICTSANVSLINNFEIVATSLIALFVFKEVISKKLWLAIALVTLAGIILTFEGKEAFDFNIGSLFVFGACVCWGLENNCTRKISHKSSVEIVVIKGTFSGLGSLAVALLLQESFPEAVWILVALVLGFVSYGLSIHFYINAQKELGAAKTSAYYAVAPFLGVTFGMLFLGERPQIPFYFALAVMLFASLLMICDSLGYSLFPSLKKK